MSQTTEPTKPPDPFEQRWIQVTIFAVAVAGAILVSGQIQISMLDHGHTTWRILLWQITRFGYWAAVAPWILRAGARLLHRETRPSTWWLRESLRAAGFAFLRLPVEASALFLLQPYSPVARYSFAEAIARGLSGLQTDFLAYGIILALGYGLAGSHEARHAELRQSMLEADLAKAQLATLRLQIQPHFLFNTLHSIAAQIRRQRNEQALSMVLGLSDLLRSTLDSSDRSLWPVERETEIVRQYVDLQKIRFSDRLRVEYRIDEEALPVLVPALVLQPLVENAIRHGISPRVSPGRVEVHARLEAGTLILEVLDDGVGLPPGFDSESTTGVGLTNARSRIRQIYGPEAKLELTRRAEGGTRARIQLPCPDVSAPPASSELRRAAG